MGKTDSISYKIRNFAAVNWRWYEQVCNRVSEGTCRKQQP